jgi:hypothetical protein
VTRDDGHQQGKVKILKLLYINFPKVAGRNIRLAKVLSQVPADRAVLAYPVSFFYWRYNYYT